VAKSLEEDYLWEANHSFKSAKTNFEQVVSNYSIFNHSSLKYPLTSYIHWGS